MTTAPQTDQRLHEIPLKQWVHEEAAKLGLTPKAIYKRLERDRHAYPSHLRRVNRRVVFVSVLA